MKVTITGFAKQQIRETARYIQMEFGGFGIYSPPFQSPSPFGEGIGVRLRGVGGKVSVLSQQRKIVGCEDSRPFVSFGAVFAVFSGGMSYNINNNVYLCRQKVRKPMLKEVKKIENSAKIMPPKIGGLDNFAPSFLYLLETKKITTENVKP